MISILGKIVADDDAKVLREKGTTVVAPTDVRTALAAEKGDIVDVEISSPGGDVFAGSEIYSALRSSDKHIRINITGIAASAASVVATAGDEILMSPTAQLMIHNARLGNGKQNEQTKTVTESLINAYAVKSKLTREELARLMDKETYITAGQAVKYGLADGFMFGDDNTALVAELDLGGSPMDDKEKEKVPGENKHSDDSKVLQDILAELKGLRADLTDSDKSNEDDSDKGKTEAVSKEDITAAVQETFMAMFGK